jgi:hypothetical protein
MPLSPPIAPRPFHPTTFQERGVLVPFTAPLLGGARMRSVENRLELIMPSLSGGRGFYVMPWASLDRYFHPTLHDKILAERIAGLRRISPRAIRDVARAVAAEGLAGEDARLAALVAPEADRADRDAVHHQLLAALTHQMDPGHTAGATEDIAQLESRARRLLSVVAARFGQNAAWAFAALGTLADALANAGVSRSSETGRTARLVLALRETARSIAAWDNSAVGAGAGQTRQVVQVADATLRMTSILLATISDMGKDMVSLLRGWTTNAAAISRIIARPEWLLDGWEPICLIWQNAREDIARGAALTEIIRYVPIIPAEANTWAASGLDLEQLVIRQQPAQTHEDEVEMESMFDLVARNERLRAAAV